MTHPQQVDPPRSPADPARSRRRSRPRPLKVCVLGLRGVPAIMGGVETHCEELYPRLRRLMPDAEIEIIGRKLYTGAAGYDYQGVRITPLPAARSKHFEALSNSLLGVLHARFRARADLVHVHAIGSGLLTPLARLLGMKAVVTHHGQDYHRQKWSRAAKLALAAGEWIAILTADRVMVVSRSVTEALARRHPRRSPKLEYVPNGMPKPAPPNSAPGSGAAVLESFGLAPGGYILAVGRLVPEKGFHDLVAAFKGLDSDLKLVIAGATDHQDRYSEALLRCASDRIVFTGFQGQAALSALYESAAVFVLPSYHEGLPIVVLEAARYGAPILISNIAPNRDIGLPAQNYFRLGDVLELRRRLAGPLDPLRVDAASISAQFDWDVIAARTAAIYRACV